MAAELVQLPLPRRDVRPMSRPSGRTLDPWVRALFEPRFGQDFGRVRVHQDAAAAELTRAGQAHAVTSGDDIAFAPDSYRPTSAQGLVRMGHELAHVVQFRRGRPDVLGETRAHEAARTIASGGLVGSHQLGGPPRGMARDPLAPTPSPFAVGELEFVLGRFNSFTAGSSELSAADATSADSLAGHLKAMLAADPTTRFIVRGRSVAVENRPDLSSERARAVMAALVAAGIPRTALSTETTLSGPGRDEVDVRVAPPRSTVADLAPGVPPPAARKGSASDAANAVLKVPAIAGLKDRAEAEAKRQLGRTTTEDKVAIGVGTAGFLGVGTAALVLSAELRNLALSQLDGVTIPLAPLADLHFQVPVPGTNVRLGLDMRALGPIPNDILRSLSIKLQTQAPQLPGAPSAGGAASTAPSLGVIFQLDLTSLPKIGKALK
ncbi:DUF4157 domain-containing protein [Jatrophihabitans telluris]|uniref:DUF4157 domain-containing protein n=1 Tax=Jatrophihabitans telluris TaxID=2038343 RepID=A0ABY4QYX2_9ACTN|nr:DUF4157 domain-containing protein [Jatrophihabitans telluris]UQX88110.1 DUF4157 domain-containing protein [Jatrophihabitans telluris]